MARCLAPTLQPECVPELCRGGPEAVGAEPPWKPGECHTHVQMLRPEEPSGLLPVAMPEDTNNEERAFSLLVRVAGKGEDATDEEWKEMEAASRGVGTAVWTWLEVMAVNALFLGGGDALALR